MHNHSRLRRSHICAELEFPERRKCVRLGFEGPMRTQSSRALPALLTHIIARLGVISSSSLYLGRSKKCNSTNKATWGTSSKVKLNQECKWHFKLINDASRGLSCKKTKHSNQPSDRKYGNWLNLLLVLTFKARFSVFFDDCVLLLSGKRCFSVVSRVYTTRKWRSVLK